MFVQTELKHVNARMYVFLVYTHNECGKIFGVFVIVHMQTLRLQVVVGVRTAWARLRCGVIVRFG